MSHQRLSWRKRSPRTPIEAAEERLQSASAANAMRPLRTCGRWFIPPAMMRLVILILGIFAVLMGLLWVGQGAGYIHWPASSFMIDQRPWILRGAILVAVGLVLVVASRLRR